MAKVGFGLFQMGEEPLLGLELPGVDTAASGFDPDRMLQMQHLVIKQVFDRASRSIGPVEDPADDDGVMGGVVVAKHAPGMMSAPGEYRLSEQAVEEARIQRIEDLVEIEVMSDGGQDAFAPAGLPDMFGLPRDGLGGDMAAVAVRMDGSDRLLVQLRKQDMSDGVMNALRGMLQQIG